MTRRNMITYEVVVVRHEHMSWGVVGVGENIVLSGMSCLHLEQAKQLFGHANHLSSLAHVRASSSN